MAMRTRMETILIDGAIASSRSTTEVSRHKHDCDTCIFMGFFGEYDLYFCPTDKSLIGRHGPDGEYKSLGIGTYVSFLNAGFTDKDDPVAECFSRLQDMGIY